MEALRTIYAEMARALDAPICFFGLYEAPAQSVNVVWQMHDGAELSGGNFPLGRGPTSEAIRTGQPKLIRNWSRDGPRVQVQYATDRAGLPESAITVPVIFDEQVIGVLSVQSYKPEAYDDEDLALVQSIADQAALAIGATQHAFDRPREQVNGNSNDIEAILASMADALLVLDDQGRLVRLNEAARALLCPDDGTVILGCPVDRPQQGHWPLGTQALTEQLLPIIDQLKHGDAPAEEVELALDCNQQRPVGCRASVLVKHGAPAGGVMVLRELSGARAT
jgi:GAF domain-containing protein